MTQFHAVMLDETGCEFGVTLEARDRSAAYDLLEDDYPESRVVQLEDPGQREQRQRDIEEYVERCLDDPYYDIDHCERW
jgi:hypothetical protein